MRFLVIMKPVEETVGQFKPRQIMRIIIQHLEYLEDLQAQGKVIESGSFAGLRGGFGILEVKSLEELNDLINFAPGMPYMETEIYPLVSGSARIKQLKKLLEKIEEREITLSPETPQ